MDGDRARSILRAGAAHAAYQEPIPEDDDQAVSEALSLIEMAREAWNSHVRGEGVLAVLKEAGIDGGNGASTSEAEEPAPPESESPESESSESQEEADEGSDPQYDADALANTEPWEDYSYDKVGEIIDGIDVFMNEEDEEQRDGLLAHIWAYESAHKARKRVLAHLEKIANERSGNEAEPVGEEEPPSAESEEGPSEDAASLEDGPDDAGADEGSAEDGDGVQDGEDGAPDAEPDPAGETGAEGGEDRREDYAVQAPPEDAGGADDEEVSEAHSLASEVINDLKHERLHIPPPIEEAPPELPHDLTTLSDTELQRVYMMFGAYAYRANFLLLVQESSARRAKERADTLHRELLVASEKYDEHNKQKTMTILEAEVESDPEVRRWREAQQKHDAFAHSYRAERDSYYKFVEMLSRLESMRHQEFERSGGKIGRRG